MVATLLKISAQILCFKSTCKYSKIRKTGCMSSIYFLSIALGVSHKIVCITSTPVPSIFFVFPHFHIYFIFPISYSGLMDKTRGPEGSCTFLTSMSKKTKIKTVVNTNEIYFVEVKPSKIQEEKCTMEPAI